MHILVNVYNREPNIAKFTHSLAYPPEQYRVFDKKNISEDTEEMP